MVVCKPYRRTIRQFADGTYFQHQMSYIKHPKFASEPEHYIRAFSIIQKDLIELFDYIEPDDTHDGCYSYRIHELFMRTCIEIEANFKAILNDNGYARRGNWSIADYRKTEKSHFLSAYQVKFPVWRGGSKLIVPFSQWRRAKSLTWYQDYNLAKHDRHGDFQKANFGNLIKSVAGLVALLSAQFHTEDFSPNPPRLVVGGQNRSFEEAIGGYFQVKFPDKWPIRDRYDFGRHQIDNVIDPFINYPYPV